MTTVAHEPRTARRYEYKVVDTGKHIEAELNQLARQAGRSSV